MSSMKLIDANVVVRYIDGCIEESKEERDDAKARANDCESSYNAGEIQMGRRIKRQIILAIPNIDAVPVVRCKECKHRGSSYSCPMRKLVMPFSGPGAFEDCTEDDGYCHLGEKMERGVESGCEQSST